MRTLEGSNRVRNGVMGIIILIIVIGVGQSFASVPMLFATPTYYAQFSDTGGIGKGDKVRIAGVDIGEVRSMNIDGDKVVIGYSLRGTQIGTESRAAIRTDTILGRRDIEIEPRGSKPLRASGILPLGQTTTPYQIYDAFFDVTKAASGWDTQTVKRSLNVLAETIDQTYPHLSAALDGVARFSDTIGKRDDQIKQLLANANKIAGVLGNRSEQINQLLVNAQSLLAAINERSYAVSMLLERVAAFSEQVKGFIDENPNLNHVLEQLRTISDVLRDRRFDLMTTLSTVAKFVASLGEAVSSGPFFKVMLANLLPYQILQPFVDAAFKKRGIDPEEFWRNAGLPAWRFPDPNGQRFPNGAPAPGPAVLEGTPEHPGPGVLKGSPCSYTPTAEGLPRPGDPLPCAGLTQGPFGGPEYGPPDVATSDPNPNGPGFTPGVPAAAIPGQ
ncbi:MAG: virulence factor Mce family protein, partial [Mycobacterium sp.]|uniref:virulence factor Mce family protein n=1 Tax=Mycobacterium sp. TaxID=1785 RepID=UPI00389A3878